MIKIIYLYIILFNSCQSEVIQVVNMFRHGARTPLNNIFNNTEIQSIGPGKLTNVGMRQHYVLGKSLKEKYKQFLKVFDEDKIEFISSPYSRTQTSLLSQVYGIFENQGQDFEDFKSIDFDFYKPRFKGINKEDFGELSDDSAIPNKYLIFNYTQSNEFFTSKNCPKIKEYTKNLNFLKNEKTNEFKIHIGKYLKENYPDLVEKDEFLITIIDNLISLKFMGYDYLKKKEEFDMIEDWLAIAYYTFYKENENYIKLKLHNLYNYMIENFDNAVENFEEKNFPNFIFLSGHDENINNFLYVLTLKPSNNLDCLIENFNNKYILKNTEKPKNCIYYAKFASSLIFELIKEEDKFKIKIIYDGNYDNPIFFGSLIELKNLFENFKIVDYKKKCYALSTSRFKTKDILYIFGMILGLVLVYFISFFIGKKVRIKYNN